MSVFLGVLLCVQYIFLPCSIYIHAGGFQNKFLNQSSKLKLLTTKYPLLSPFTFNVKIHFLSTLYSPALHHLITSRTQTLLLLGCKPPATGALVERRGAKFNSNAVLLKNQLCYKSQVFEATHVLSLSLSLSLLGVLPCAFQV